MRVKVARLSRALAFALAIAVFGLMVYLWLFLDIMGSSGTGGEGLDDGLIGYWRFEEASGPVVDSSGHGNDGLFVNSAVTSGRFGRALSLRGASDSHVSIPASQSLNAFADQITVSAWVFPKKPPDNFLVVVSRQIGTREHPDQFYLGFGPKDAGVYYKWHLATINDGTVRDRSIYAGDPDFNRWIHISGVYDGWRMRLYVDGEEIDSRWQFGTIQVDANPITIGGEENGSEAHVVDGELDGLIDEVRIYNRALSSAEIRAIYQLAAP